MSLYEPGRYICVGGKGFVPRVIEIATRSKFAHVVMVETRDGGIIEAMPGGVRRAHISQYAGLPACSNLAERMTATQQAQIITAAQGMIGVPYNDLAIADDALESLGVVWKWFANLANGDHEVICSQAVSMWGAAAGLDWSCGRRDLCEVTPANLAKRPWTVSIDIETA
jgi:uncharacterized protein YycO